MPVRLIDKDGTKVTDDVDDTEDDTALGQHGQERTTLVVFDWTAVLLRRWRSSLSWSWKPLKVVDLARGADQVVARGVHFEQNVTNTAKMIAVCKYDAINVAFKPPAIVYTITPTESRNQRCRCPYQSTRSSGCAAQNQHRRNDDVRQEAKEQEDLVSGGAPSGVDDLTIVAPLGDTSSLERQDAKQSTWMWHRTRTKTDRKHHTDRQRSRTATKSRPTSTAKR